MGMITRKVGISALIVSLSFLVGFLLGVDAGGILPLALYLTGLLLGSLVVAFVAFRLGVRPKELAKTSILIVPAMLVVVLGLIRIVAPLFEAPPSGPTEGEGFVIVLLFLILPALLIGLIGSLFELPLWKRGGNAAV